MLPLAATPSAHTDWQHLIWGSLMNSQLRLALAIAAALFYPATSSAGYMVLDGNNPQPNQENILLNNGSVGNTVIGLTNNSNQPVAFTSLQLLVDPSSGQARVEATTPPAQLAISSAITITLPPPGFGISSAIFNAFVGGGVGSGGSLTISILGFDSTNAPENAVFTLDDDNDPLSVGNGSNFFTVLTTAGSRITSLQISPNVGTTYADLRQIRLALATPEPSAFAIASTSLFALSAIRRRR
jgi:hypothetical protein